MGLPISIMTDFALVYEPTGKVVNVITIDTERSRYKPPVDHMLIQVGDGYTTILGWFWSDVERDFIAPADWVPDPNDDASMNKRKLVPPQRLIVDPLVDLELRLRKVEETIPTRVR